MTADDLLISIILTGVRLEKVQADILEDMKTLTLDKTVKLIEKMMYAKETNAGFKRRREGSKVAAIRSSKTSYRKNN